MVGIMNKLISLISADLNHSMSRMRSGRPRLRPADDMDAAIQLSLATLNDDELHRIEAGNQLNKYLQEYGLQFTCESQQKWDGNCWYNSVLYHYRQIDKKATALSLRQGTIKYMQDHKMELMDFMSVSDPHNSLSSLNRSDLFDSQCLQLRKRGVYKTSTSLCDMIPEIISKAFNIRLVIYNSPERSIVTFGPEGAFEVKVGRITISGMEHVNAVVPLK